MKQLRKPNAQARIPRLPDKVRADLDHWLLGLNLSYSEVRRRLKDVHKVTISSGALSNYYTRENLKRVLEKASQMRTIADGAQKDLKDIAGELHDPMVGMLSVQATEALLSQMTDPKELEILFSLILKIRQQEIDFRKLKIAEANAKRASRADDIANDKKLSADEKTARIKQIFGIL